MTPAAVQGIYVAVPFAMALASQLATWLGKAIGRVQAVITLRFTGLACFSGMVVLDSLGLDKTSPEVKWAIAVLYVCRTALMNCSYPLEESILMDYAPKATRARWKSLESVSIAGWCGSAFVGGILADHYGYTFTFIITIGLQAAGTLVYASLLGVVVVEVNEPSNSDDGDETKNKTTGLDGYQKPPIEDPEEVTAVA
jgi:MFS family permease